MDDKKQALMRKLTLWLVSFMIISIILVSFVGVPAIPVFVGGGLALAVILFRHKKSKSV